MTQTTALQGFPLSPQQKRLWQLQSAASNSPYCVETVIEIQGPLQLDCLRTALEQVVARHEILRTTFPTLPGMGLPLQVISDRPQIDLQVRSINDPVSNLEPSKKQEFTVSVTCLQHTSDYHQLHLNLSALWVDGASLRQFVSELAQCYAGYPFTEDPLQYADIAAWQNDLLNDPDSANACRYWQQLPLDTIAIQLPITNPNSTAQSSEFQPQIHSISLKPELLAALQTQAEHDHVPLKTLLLTCWLVLLQRLTQAENLVVGVTSEGRHYDELATAIGPLTKALPVTVALDRDILFSTLLAQVHTQVQASLDWQDAFDWSLLKLPTLQSKDIAYCPFGFGFADEEIVVLAADLSFKLQQLITYCDRFSIQLVVTGLNLDFYYNEVEYSSSAIMQLASYFQTLLQSVVEQQDTTIQKLAILNECDLQHLLTRYQTTANYPSDQTIYQLFEAQVQQTPDAIAVISEQQSLTYAELNARANQLAHYLRQQGVGSEVIVGLCLERSPELIIGLLAILKAGGAFLPLEPSYPDQRLRYITQSAPAALVLTQKSFALRWSDRDLLILDQATISWSEMPVDNLEQTAKADNLAYVIYTSGSTGEPKGVAVEHRQVVNYVCAISDRLSLPSGSHFGLVSTIAADLGYTMLFPALCTGGCLHLSSTERATDPVAFADYCRRHPLDVLKLTPSHLAALLTSEQAIDFLPRQQLIFGGEALPWTLIQQLRQSGTTCQVWNHYGPTEATIGVLTAPVPDLADTATVPLGQPLPNTQVYLLDDQQQPVPIGVAGEIYIGGAGVARGYLHQPQLTQERFIANPFGSEGSERLYRTGDRARYRPDGSLEFLGRRDDQVKIRGFRIELGEIEAVLRQQPEVAQAVVVARPDASELLQLVGYVVMQPAEVSLEVLQQALQKQLPAHMMPTLVRLKTLPLLPNGKVDRQALPSPDLVQRDTPVYVAPCTPVEIALVEIWSKLLGLSQVGIHDNFFALGGDSILSIQMIARAHQMGVRLTPKQIYQHPTIAELATVADTASNLQAEQGLVTGLVPLTPIQHWFFEQTICDHHHWNQAVLLEPQASLDLQVLQQTVQHLLQHHDVLRSRFQQTEQGWQQSIHDSAPAIPVELVDLTSLPTSEQWQVLECRSAEFQSSLNLTQGNLVQLVVFTLNLDGTPTQRLLIIMHHLIIDGVSWRILLEDLQTAYQHLKQGQSVQLPAKTTSVQQWGQRLQEYADSEVMKKEAEYWKAVVSEGTIALPVDRTTESIPISSLQTIEFVLSPAETQTLLHELPQTLRLQVQEVLLTALVQTLITWVGSSTVTLELEGHGREDLFASVNLSRTVGWLTSLFPVQLTLTPELEAVEALQSIKTQLRQIPNGGIGYGVWRYLSADQPLLTKINSPVRFNYLGQADASLNQLSLFRWATESCGSNRSDRHTTLYLLDISGLVQAEQLRLSWTYSDRAHNHTTIQHLVQQFGQNLRSLLGCNQTQPNAYTPTDFPLANVNSTDLNKLLLKLSQAGGE